MLLFLPTNEVEEGDKDIARNDMTEVEVTNMGRRVQGIEKEGVSIEAVHVPDVEVSLVSFLQGQNVEDSQGKIHRVLGNV